MIKFKDKKDFISFLDGMDFDTFKYLFSNNHIVIAKDNHVIVVDNKIDITLKVV